MGNYFNILFGFLFICKYCPTIFVQLTRILYRKCMQLKQMYPINNRWIIVICNRKERRSYKRNAICLIWCNIFGHASLEFSSSFVWLWHRCSQYCCFCHYYWLFYYFYVCMVLYRVTQHKHTHIQKHHLDNIKSFIDDIKYNIWWLVDRKLS